MKLLKEAKGREPELIAESDDIEDLKRQALLLVGGNLDLEHGRFWNEQDDSSTGKICIMDLDDQPFCFVIREP